MAYEYKTYAESAEFIKEKLAGFSPEILLVLGSGLGFIGDEIEDPIFVDYKDIPNFKVSTAPGHKGRFVFGNLQGKKVAVMQGRMHTYEGYSLQDVTFATRVMRLVGCKTLFVTNAAGAINTSFGVGEIMLITDHIKYFLASPLTGPNIEEFGTRFPDMSHVYDPALCEVARSAAKDLGITLREGVYTFFPGPQFETPAEIRAARVLGADAAGMSTVPEAIAAVHCGMKVVGFSLLANMAAGVLDQPLSGEEVNEVAEQSAPRFSKLVREVVRRM